MVQLHGTEPPEWCAEIDAPVIKAIHVVHDASAEQLRALMEPYRPWVTYFLLDTHKTNLWGGTGESFNWRLARELSAEYPILLAGGIARTTWRKPSARCGRWAWTCRAASRPPRARRISTSWPAFSRCFMRSANNWKRRPRNEDGSGAGAERKDRIRERPTVSGHHIALSCGAQRLNELL